jgi:hypothetical protein
MNNENVNYMSKLFNEKFMRRRIIKRRVRE